MTQTAAPTAPEPLAPVAEAEKAIQGRSLGEIAWRRLKRDKVAIAGGIVVLLVILVAVFAPLLSSWYGQDPYTPNPKLLNPDTTFPEGPWGGASSEHWLGIEPVGSRDVLARLMYGARSSLIVGFLATLLSLIFGVIFGLIAGYFRGWVDTLLSRTMDLLLSFPTLLFSISLLVIFRSVDNFLFLEGQGVRFGVIIFVLGFFAWPYIGRIVRGQVLSVREKEFVDAARSLGATSWRITAREILPNLIGPILVYTTLTIPTNILGEAGLSYLGVGLQPPAASWGQMLSDAGRGVELDPTYLLWPGLAVFITVLAFNLFGDGLRDALDPKSDR